MDTNKVYDLKANGPDDAQLWQDAEMRKMIIQGGIEQAKDHGCRMLRVLDADGKQLHLEGFGPRLWDIVTRVHEGLDQLVKDTQHEVRVIHGLVQDALNAHDRGDTKAAHAAIKLAMDREHFAFGECENTGDDALLEALGYDIELEEG